MKPTTVIIGLIAGIAAIGLATFITESGPFASRAEETVATATSSATATPSAPSNEGSDESTSEAGSEAAESTPARYQKFTTEADAQALAAEGKDVIYFFHASWCPDCIAIQKRLDTPDELARLKDNTVIVVADFDTESELKKKYNIVRQTSFVRIDGEGNAVKTGVLANFNSLVSF